MSKPQDLYSWSVEVLQLSRQLTSKVYQISYMLCIKDMRAINNNACQHSHTCKQ